VQAADGGYIERDIQLAAADRFVSSAIRNAAAWW
jgi:hypothetical protein